MSAHAARAGWQRARGGREGGAGLSRRDPARQVTVVESHGIPGGAAPRPMPRVDRAVRGRGANPIAHVLQAIDEPLDLIEYNRWNVIIPEGQFLTEARPRRRGTCLEKQRLRLQEQARAVVLCLSLTLQPPW